MNKQSQTKEHIRLAQSNSRQKNWQRWGTYLSERQWGTVREDYSENQDAWRFFPHDHARSRAYRWGEDGLLGWCDRQCRLCFSFAFWNGNDPILKERLFGLNGPEGNHGEDVKEEYFYTDAAPTHSYCRGVYRYPINRFPYEELIKTNGKIGRQVPEFELADSGIFEGNQFFDCEIEYAKADDNDCLMRLTVHNRSDSPAALTILSQFWARNTWIWGCEYEDCTAKPTMMMRDNGWVQFNHQTLGDFEFSTDTNPNELSGVIDDQWLFTENVTNPNRHPDALSTGKYFKDAFHRYLIDGEESAVNPKLCGSKCANVVRVMIAPDNPYVVECRLRHSTDVAREPMSDSRHDFSAAFTERKQECDDFYDSVIPDKLTDDLKNVSRQSYAGLLWTKQFYNYVVESWTKGDPEMTTMPIGRSSGRNSQWQHLFNRDVISMPDKWEYPWYAAWDSAFHMIPMADVDLDYAKSQLILFLREWYMHPNGQIPAYEWNFGDVNPPVHAWACWRIYELSCDQGNDDRIFLARTFQKLLLNFTWWINRKDPQGNNIFAGGFLGLDNIGIFDRSKPMPGGGYLDQADGTAWMAFFCGQMLNMAMRLADGNPAYGDMASKFFEHYVAIAESMNTSFGNGLWDEEDGFYYDQLWINNQPHAMKIRSLVGIIPLFTNVVLDEATIATLPGFAKRMDWFLQNKPQMSSHMTYLECSEPAAEGNSANVKTGKRLLAIPSESRFRKILSYLLDESEFLSDYGIRSLSAAHREHPFNFAFGNSVESISYVPGESDSWMFGGNSNWRGPIWFPINYLIVESLRKYHDFYGDSFQIECPTGSGINMNLDQVANEIERRLILLFQLQQDGRRSSNGAKPPHPFPRPQTPASHNANDEAKIPIWFYEYFHGDNGAGLGASHQTGWTSLISSLLNHAGRNSSLSS